MFEKVLNKIIKKQNNFENNLDIKIKKEKGIFFTNNIFLIKQTISIIDFNNIINKKILEPSCGNGILLIAIILKLYDFGYTKQQITDFIGNNVFFNELSLKSLKETENNIKEVYYELFGTKYNGKLNSFNEDFIKKDNILIKNYKNYFDYIIGNPPFVSLYGRRAVNKTEELRKYILNNYKQFPNTIKNGKINLSMLFIENGLDLLKKDGKLNYILDISFFEPAFFYIRKYIIDRHYLEEIMYNLGHFKVSSGQIILSLSKKNNNKLTLINAKEDNKKAINYDILSNNNYKINTNIDENINKLLNKIKNKLKDNTIERIFGKKSLRTSTMLLNYENEFTTKNKTEYYFYRGNSLKNPFGKLNYEKYFIYDKKKQDIINNKIKKELELKGVKNKKRIGLGDKKVFDYPKVFIRQSAKKLIASLDLNKSASNNSLYIFSLKSDKKSDINMLKYITCYLNSDIATFYSQYTNIIRYIKGKQPQIKLSDLRKLPIPIIKNNELFNNLINNYGNIDKINTIFYDYFGFNEEEIKEIKQYVLQFIK